MRLDVQNSGSLIKRTGSRCPECLDRIPAEIHERDGQVVMLKSCPDHGDFEVTLAADRRFYYLATGSRGQPSCGDRTSSAGGSGGGAGVESGGGCGCSTEASRKGSTDPFEVLSTCIALIEIVDSCNLTCPTCYAASPWGIDDNVDCIDVDAFVERVQGVIDRKGAIDILQLSGGEPTIHPRFFDILDWALEHGSIGYVLVNTNGVRIANDPAFRERLAAARRTHGKLELYAQYDGPQREGQLELRGADLRETRRDAIDLIGELGVPSTLAMVVTPHTLPHLGDALRFGLARPHCRGIAFQPMFQSGRIPRSDTATPRSARPTTAHASISVGDVVLGVVEQSGGLLEVEDFTPLPCGDPNCHTIGFLLRTDEGSLGLSRLLDLPALQGFLGDRLNYDLADMRRCGCETEPLGELLKSLEIGPDRPFRIFVKPFMDAWTYDEDRIDRCCTHVIRPDGKLDSFCRYYLQGGARGLG